MSLQTTEVGRRDSHTKRQKGLPSNSARRPDYRWENGILHAMTSHRWRCIPVKARTITKDSEQTEIATDK